MPAFATQPVTGLLDTLSGTQVKQPAAKQVIQAGVKRNTKTAIRQAIALIMTLALASTLSLLTACAAPNNTTASDTLNGTTAELMPKLLEKAQSHLAAGQELPKGFTEAVTTDNCELYLGLTAEQFTQYIDNATISNAAISTIPHQVVLLKCLSAADAEQVARLISAGYNSERLICVFPDQSFVQQSGSYVMMVSSSTENSEALQAGFSELAGGNVGEPQVFFTLAE
jgi:hypothetical protein